MNKDMEKEKQLLRDLGEVDEKFIEEADAQIVKTITHRSRSITWKPFAAVAAAAAAVLILVRLPERNRNDDIVPPADNNGTTAVSSAAIETAGSASSDQSVSDMIKETEINGAAVTSSSDPAAVTEQTEKAESLSSVFTGSGKQKPQNYELSTEKSYLYIRNTDSVFYSVENGYYRLHFLNDSDFENRINQDIKNAMDEISRWYDPGYLAEKDGSLYPFDWVERIANSHGENTELEKANGQAIELICENGYLSVALGYLDCDGYVPGGDGRPYGYERRWDVVRTLNYDLVGRKKIEKFTDLFYEGTDVLSELNKAVFDDMANDKAEKITTCPEYFTIYYMLQENDGRYYNLYDTLLFNDRDYGGEIIKSMVTSEYRDMSDIIVPDLADRINQDVVPAFTYKFVTEDGVEYTRIESANFKSAAEVEKMNEDIKKIQHDAYEKFGKTSSGPVRISLLEDSGLKNIWSVDGLNKEMAYCYDTETLELLRIEDIIGENWKDYIRAGEYTEGDYSLSIIQFNDEKLWIEYQGETGVSVIVPEPREVISPKYLAD